MAMGAAYKIATGSETGTFTVTSSISGRAAMCLMSVKNWHGTTPPEIAFSGATSTTAQDPPNLDPGGWAAADTLWIAVAAGGQTSLTGSWGGITSAPTNYTNYGESAIAGGDVVGACQVAVAFRGLNASAENPGAFTTDTSPEIERAATIAVRPVPAQIVTLTPATETDTPGTLLQVHSAGPAAEADGAQALSFVKPIHKTLGAATETDAAQALSITHEGGAQDFDLLPAAEADTAQALSFDKPIRKTLGVAAETDSAQVLSFEKPIFKTLGPAAEADGAQALSFDKPIHKTLGAATEADTAPALDVGGPRALNPALEVDAAQALDYAKPIIKALAAATETDTAGHLTQVHSLAPTSETDVAQVLSISGGGEPTGVSITPAAETDTAQALGVEKHVTIAPAGLIVGPPPFFDFIPNELAVALSYEVESGGQQVTLAPAAESDAAQALTAAKRPAVGPALETDMAQALSIQAPIYVTLVAATELDEALVLPLGIPPITHPPLGGTFTEAPSGGTVTVVVRGGSVVEYQRGGVIDGAPTGGSIDDASSGGDVDAPVRSGDVVEVLTGAEVY
jgi:hypothetical protein